MKTARVGLVGLGAVAQMHVRAYRNLPGIHIAGCVDVQPEKVQAFSNNYGIPGFLELSEMLQACALDAVCVLTPARAHEAAVIECARAGVNVLCEKPLALSVEACDRMIESCRQARVMLCYGASYRYLPALIRAKQIIEEGEIGDVLVLRESMVGGTGVENRGTLGPGHFPEGGPGGSAMGLIDHGIHLADAFSWLVGRPVARVVGRGNIAGGRQRPEYLIMEFENDAVGELLYEDGTFSTDLPAEGGFSWGQGWALDGITTPGSWEPSPGVIHVHGTRGALRIHHYANALYLRTAAGIRQVALADRAAPAQFAAQMLAFVEAIGNGLPAPVPAEAGREACRLITSVYASAAGYLHGSAGLATHGIHELTTGAGVVR